MSEEEVVNDEFLADEGLTVQDTDDDGVLIAVSDDDDTTNEDEEAK